MGEQIGKAASRAGTLKGGKEDEYTMIIHGSERKCNMIDELVTLAKERQAVMKDLAARFGALETEEAMTCETLYERECRVHINYGLQFLADECGATVKTSTRGAIKYPWKHSFMYDGVLFFELSETEMLK